MTLCSSLPSAPESVPHPLDDCIAQGVSELHSHAECLFTSLSRVLFKRKFAQDAPRDSVRGGASPCGRQLQGFGDHGDDFRWWCAMHIDQIWGQVCGNRTYTRGAEIALALAKIGEVIPSIRDELLATAQAGGMGLLRHSCGPARMECCFEIFNSPASLALRMFSAAVIGKRLLSSCKPGSAAFRDLDRAMLLLPRVVAVITQWFRCECPTYSDRCKRSVEFVTDLCLSEPLQRPEVNEICTSAFATFAVWTSSE